MPVVDELITRYTADPSGYVRGTAKVSAAARHVGTAIGRSLVVGGVAVAGFAAVSMKAAAEFDTMTRKFAGAFGGFDAARAMMADLEQYATRSAFSLEALADAATMLAVAGLDVKRFLPLVERFALVVSGVDPQGLKQVAGALMRSKGGGFGEAMEVFRRAGIGAPELAAQGIKVSKGGQVMASPDEFFRALEGASQPLKRIADAVTGGDENTIANIGDAIGRSMRVFGQHLNDALLPKFEAFTAALTKLVDDGKVTVLASQFANVVDSLTGSGGMEEAANLAALAMFRVGRWAEMFVETGKDASRGRIDWWDILFPIPSAVNKMLGNPVGDFFKNTKEEFDAALPTRAKKPGEQPQRAEEPKQEEARSVGYLSEIAENTRRALDLQRVALGGGALAGAGISPVRVRAMSASAQPARRAVGLIFSMFSDMAAPPGMSRR